MSVAIGYVPGAFGQGGDDPNFLRALVALGDRYEYDSIWLSDRICSDRFSLEPMVALSLVAGYSDRLKFGTSVLALPLRNPVVLGQAGCHPGLAVPGPLFSPPSAWARRTRTNTKPAASPKPTAPAAPTKPSL